MSTAKRNRPSLRRRPRRDFVIADVASPSNPAYDADDAEELAELEFPPVNPGDHVKVNFLSRRDGRGESMWLKVAKVRGTCLTGVLTNDPVLVNARRGDRFSLRVRQTVQHEAA